MLHADNALFYEMIRNAHCPDPRCAARFRPFAIVMDRVRSAETATKRATDTAACCPDKAAEPERCC